MSRKRSQKARVLDRLRDAGERGVCARDFIYDTSPGIPRVSARILELRRDGWEIWTMPCDLHPHLDPDTGARNPAVKYVLTGRADA